MLRAFFKKLEAGKQNMTMCHSAELIGYQTPSLFQKNCTASISKDQSQKRCQDFPDLLLVTESLEQARGKFVSKSRHCEDYDTYLYY